MNPDLRTLAADLLSLYGDLPDPGDGVSLDTLPPADRKAIEALIRADPLYDPDGADAPLAGRGLWPTGKVCRALREMMRADDHAAEVTRLRGEVDVLLGAMVGQVCGSWYTYDRSLSQGGARASEKPHSTREQAVAGVRTRLGLDGGTAAADPADAPLGPPIEDLGNYVMPFGAFELMTLAEIDRAGMRYYLEQLLGARIHSDPTREATKRYLDAQRETLHPRSSAIPG